MSGKKGRSGRRPLELEKFIDKVTAKAWNKVNYKLGQDDPQSYSIAAAICIEDMLTKIDATNRVQLSDNDIAILRRYTNDTIVVSSDNVKQITDAKNVDNSDGEKSNVGVGVGDVSQESHIPT